MAMHPERKTIKVGVKEGGGEPPGYKWNVEILDQAFEEAMGFLNEDQYSHMANQMRELASQDDPTHSDTIDVRSVEEFHEIRDKGGLLRNLNVRVFYMIHKAARAIVVLGAIKKENNGPTPTGDRIRMRRRRRLYLESRQSDS
jgi:hypothetical protein